MREATLQDFTDKNILLGICGGIAAYKAAILARELAQLGANIKVVMTEAAGEFISPLTLQALTGNEVRTHLFDPQAEGGMSHIELARWAHVLLIAPASANCLAKLANGIADDLLSTIYLATRAPTVICPAMNRLMWEHPATQTNHAMLLKRGVIVVGPQDGFQACGEIGLGRLGEPQLIIDALRLLDVHQALVGQEVLITAGPTWEPIDPVRYLSNRSSGKMGYALAKAAQMAGAKVILITGPTKLQPPLNVELYACENAKDMQQLVFKHFQAGMIFIAAAAVSDYRIVTPELNKIKKNGRAELLLSLTKNEDILKAISTTKKAKLVVGFAAETSDLLQEAKRKMKNKQLDILIANQVGPNLGFNTEDNQVIVFTKSGQIELPRAHKVRLAGQIIAIISKTLQNDLHFDLQPRLHMMTEEV